MTLVPATGLICRGQRLRLACCRYPRPWTPKTTLLCRIALPIILALVAWSANANPILYSFAGTFSASSATATGTFVYDAATNTVTFWSIAVDAGPLFPALTYTPANSTATTVSIISGGQPTIEIFETVDGSRLLRITPLAALDGIASTGLDTSEGGNGGVECFNCSPFRDLASGTFTLANPNIALVTTAAVTPNPVPAGQFAAFGATVVAPASGMPTPTGTVEVFNDSSVPVCTFTLPETSCSTVPQGSGNHVYILQYLGDENYNASDLFLLSFSVASAPVVAATPVPTLSLTALAALVTLLAACSLWVMRMRLG